MEAMPVEPPRPPYRIVVGRTIIECDLAEEAIALADLLGRGSTDEQTESSTTN